MIGDDPVAGLGPPFGRDPGGIHARPDQRAEQVDLVIVVGALQYRGEALDPHAGIDRGFRQIRPLAAGELLILHEHEVPDLDEAVALLVGRARRAAGNMRAVVVENLRARTAGAELPHGPEIVGPIDAENAGLGQPRDLFPELERVVVVDIDGGDQLLFGEREGLGEEVPGELDRVILEIIAKGKVPQHLKEGVVAGRVAHVVEVVVLAAGAHALLRADRALVRPLLDTGEDVLELHHPGIGEHQRGVVARHERRRRHDRVPVLGEIVEEGRPDFVDAAHQRIHHMGALLPPLPTRLTNGEA